ncbi:MAG: hypothetical protein KA248_01260 [Kiritimatiellae bacterium]|nr:hypothetical protein [Kiritimatiellia bacterium]
MAYNRCITPGISASLLAAGLFLVAAGCASLDKMTSPSAPQEDQPDPVVHARIEELSARWEQEPVPVGLEPQVFFDDAVILEKSEGWVRKQGVPVKLNEGEPVLKPDRSWEGPIAGAYFTVLTNDAGLIQMWYSCGGETYRGMMVGSYMSLAYAESDDGFEWRKPRLLPDFDNVVLSPAFGAGVTYDRHERRGGHRYKIVYGSVGMRGVSPLHGLAFGHSGNGKKWSFYEDVRMLDAPRSDTQCNILWDEELDLYRVYSRTMTSGGRSSRLDVRPVIGASRLFVVARALFLPLPVAPWTHVADTFPPESGEIYSMTVYKYGGLYIGNLALFSKQILIDYCLAYSRDGATWDLQYVSPEQALIPRGGEKSFDAGMVYPCHGQPIEHGAQWLLYYGGSWRDHSQEPHGEPREYVSAVGVASIRKEGFLYLENEGETARLVTKSFVLEGSALEVNADASKGRVAVDVLPGDGDASASPLLRGVPIERDGVRVGMEWKDGRLADWVGRTVRLRFDTRGPVRLYGFQVVQK